MIDWDILISFPCRIFFPLDYHEAASHVGLTSLTEMLPEAIMSATRAILHVAVQATTKTKRGLGAIPSEDFGSHADT